MLAWKLLDLKKLSRILVFDEEKNMFMQLRYPAMHAARRSLSRFFLGRMKMGAAVRRLCGPGGAPAAGSVLDRVISQASSEDQTVLYKLADYKKGGLLLETYAKGGMVAAEKLIREELAAYMYAGGKGQVINRAEYLRWKFRDQEQVVVPIEASLSPHDPLARWSDHTACWQMCYRGALGESLLHVLIICDTKEHGCMEIQGMPSLFACMPHTPLPHWFQTLTAKAHLSHNLSYLRSRHFDCELFIPLLVRVGNCQRTLTSGTEGLRCSPRHRRSGLHQVRNSSVDSPAVRMEPGTSRFGGHALGIEQ
ncbi:hypothetical protein EVAR_9694_1 [Eumeta japonica]|uniref:Uncharacterized protein n=1 Tax=Eumeta variegata TaxID=151549 RepID=A0A4C1YD29_EUMVA|nr:hypothetical protein EVAR_9694_1 [Eumeta japonica]